MRRLVNAWAIVPMAVGAVVLAGADDPLRW